MSSQMPAGFNVSTVEGLLAGIAGFITEAYDYVALTYVAVGNGEGQIQTATYKSGGSGGTTVATLTITYDAQNRIADVTKS